MAGAGDERLTPETMSAVAAARARAAGNPPAEEIARLLDKAARHRGDLSADDIRKLGADAIRQAQRVSYLLGRLSGLLGETGEDS